MGSESRVVNKELCVSSSPPAQRSRGVGEGGRGGGGILSIITLRLWNEMRKYRSHRKKLVEEVRALLHGLDLELSSGRDRREIQQRVAQLYGFLETLQQW
jgi:hypothetical protein